MVSQDSERHGHSRRDRQLQGVSFEAAMEKRRLDQALNAKEFALCSGVSYSTARSWFHLPGFPVFHGHVFWEDFVSWRAAQMGIEVHPATPRADAKTPGHLNLPSRAAHILLDF